MKPVRDIEETIRRNLHVTAGPDLHDRVLARMRHADPSTTTATAPKKPIRRKTIMSNPIVKFALAAAVVAAGLIGMSLFLHSGSGVAWAEVVEKVEASRGFISWVTQTHTQAHVGKSQKSCFIVYNSPEHGVRMDSYEGGRLAMSTYFDYAERTYVSLMHQNKQYTRKTLPEEAASAGESIVDPKNLVKQFLAGEYRKLGKRSIDGVEAEGIEVKDPKGFTANFPVDSVVAQLWVDVKTGYPVKLASETIGNSGDLRVTTVSDRFQWNVEFDVSDFRPVIPPDYTLME